MGRKTILKILGIMFTLVGICLLAACVYSLKYVGHIKADYTLTEATVTDFGMNSSDSYNSNDGKICTYVEFTVDGEKHQAMLGSYSNSWHSGSKIEIYYNPDFPDEAVSLMSLKFLPLIFAIFGGAFALAGTIEIITERKKKNHENHENPVNQGNQADLLDQINQKLKQIVNLKRSMAISGIIFILVGISMLTAFGYTLKYAEQIKSDYVLTEALVLGTSSRSSYSHGSGSWYRSGDATCVSFTVNGEDHQAILGSYSSSWNPGSRIEIYYNPELPDEAESVVGLRLPCFITGTLGVVFTLAGMIEINVLRKMKTRKTQNGVQHENSSDI